MDWKIFFATFGTVFLAEMGDKTQLAAMTMTAQTKAPWIVLVSASLALIAATVIGVAFGSVITNYVPESVIKKVAGSAFVVIGAVMLLGKW